jgi:hypothetical protein
MMTFLWPLQQTGLVGLVVWSGGGYPPPWPPASHRPSKEIIPKEAICKRGGG